MWNMFFYGDKKIKKRIIKRIIDSSMKTRKKGNKPCCSNICLEKPDNNLCTDRVYRRFVVTLESQISA